MPNFHGKMEREPRVFTYLQKWSASKIRESFLPFALLLPLPQAPLTRLLLFLYHEAPACLYSRRTPIPQAEKGGSALYKSHRKLRQLVCWLSLPSALFPNVLSHPPPHCFSLTNMLVGQPPGSVPSLPPGGCASPHHLLSSAFSGQAQGSKY